MNEPCHIYEWAMSHIWMSHVTYMNEPCHLHEWAMSHIWMSHVAYMNEPCHLHEWAMSHARMRHATYMQSYCHVYGTNLSHTCTHQYFLGLPSSWGRGCAANWHFNSPRQNSQHSACNFMCCKDWLYHTPWLNSTATWHVNSPSKISQKSAPYCKKWLLLTF